MADDPFRDVPWTAELDVEVYARLHAAELADERRRQLTVEGFDVAWDDRNGGSDYCATLAAEYLNRYLRDGDRARLVQAGALVLAALYQLDRAGILLPGDTEETTQDD